MVAVEKEASIVDVVEDENPLPLLAIAQPVVHKLEYVCLRIPPSKDLDRICNIAIALLKPGRVARVDPKNERVRRSLSGLVRIFDGKLRLPLWRVSSFPAEKMVSHAPNTT